MIGAHCNCLPWAYALTGCATTTFVSAFWIYLSHMEKLRIGVYSFSYAMYRIMISIPMNCKSQCNTFWKIALLEICTPKIQYENFQHFICGLAIEEHSRDFIHPTRRPLNSPLTQLIKGTSFRKEVSDVPVSVFITAAFKGGIRMSKIHLSAFFLLP